MKKHRIQTREDTMQKVTKLNGQLQNRKELIELAT